MVALIGISVSEAFGSAMVAFVECQCQRFLVW